MARVGGLVQRLNFHRSHTLLLSLNATAHCFASAVSLRDMMQSMNFIERGCDGEVKAMCMRAARK
jgi:hypothetical protein